MSERLSKEELLKWLTSWIEDGWDVDELPGDRQAYEQIKSLIENQSRTNEKQLKTLIQSLARACKTLMDEVCDRRATDWGIVNDALCEAEKYLKNEWKRMESDERG